MVDMTRRQPWNRVNLVSHLALHDLSTILLLASDYLIHIQVKNKTHLERAIRAGSADSLGKARVLCAAVFTLTTGAIVAFVEIDSPVTNVWARLG